MQANIYYMSLAYSARFYTEQNADQLVVCSGLLSPYRLFVVSRKNIPRAPVSRFDLGIASKRVDSANYLSIDSKGNLYATDFFDNCVRKLNIEGKNARICVAASCGILRPHRLHLSESLGCLYIAESGPKGRVWAFRGAVFK